MLGWTPAFLITAEQHPKDLLAPEALLCSSVCWEVDASGGESTLQPAASLQL